MKLSQRLDKFLFKCVERQKYFLPFLSWFAIERLLFRRSGIIAVARAALERGDVKTTFRLCRFSAYLSASTAVEGRVLIASMCRWLAEFGFLEEALGYYSELDGDGGAWSKFAKVEITKFAFKFALYGEQYQRYIRQALRSTSSPKQVYYAIRYLHMLGALQKGVFEELESRALQFSRKNPYSQRMLSALLNVRPGMGLGRPDWLDDRRFRELEGGLSFAVKHRFMDGMGDNNSSLYADEDTSLHFFLEKNLSELASVISDPAMTIGVVGNSPCEIGQGKGEAIDSHDLIFRFNFSVAYDYAQDYGRNTNYLVCNVSNLSRLVSSAFPPGLILAGPDFLDFPSNIGVLKQAVAQGVAPAILPKSYFVELAELLGAAPSSGMLLVYFIFRMRGSFQGVNLFGISLTDQVSDQPGAANYFRKSRPSFRHNWPGEMRLLQELVSTEDSFDFDSFKKMQLEKLRNSQCITRDEFRPLRLKLVGDHSRYHCGSAAVVSFIKREMNVRGVVVKDDSYDVLIVNGEGSMHDNQDDFLYKMKAITDAKTKNKAVYLVNSVWQNNSNEYDDILKSLDGIVVRESKSQSELLSKHGVNSTVLPDFSYFAKLSADASIDNFNNEVVLTDVFSQDLGSFVRFNGTYLKRARYLDMRDYSWSSLVASLKTARILVTGRHHAMYAACKAEVPFVIFPGNTHKMEGLFEAAGVDIPICRHWSDVAEAIDYALSHRYEFDRLFSWLRAQDPWRLQV
ncbi:glycosyltransferase family 29 protein [Pseudomaricurvus sp. HS19]|uniref:glycosyltransferase family 29 protein n=1 Tax=Pseudomaricurvus sp. HS19 TaxID=2692626 RepID=UPI0013694DFA|nr:glycosyltransferase family 29 protein [Pseudomaricurvus sp. HS19]MYM64711.1 hypothetical protein [Pseudomaricurvus sp. HS19]